MEVQNMTIQAAPNNYDVICIQEPYFDRLGLTRATAGWYVVYPTKHRKEEESRTCSVILVNRRMATRTWTQIKVDSVDISAIKISNENTTISIYNIYNDCTNDESTGAMAKHLETRERNEETNPVSEELRHMDVWLGDFNRHHALWESEDNHRLCTRQNAEAAEPLLQLIAEYGMEQALPKGIPTIVNSGGNRTRPDNVFVTSDEITRIVKCQTREQDTPPKADHFPIVTWIDFEKRLTNEVPARNFRATDWREFCEYLTKELDKLGDPETIESKEELDAALDRLERAIIATMDKIVPRRKLSPYAKRWWTRELDEARKEARRAADKARQYWEYPTHSSHEIKRKACNTYSNLYKKSKKDHWTHWIEFLSNQTVWDAHKFIRAEQSDGGRTRIPALVRTNEDGSTTTVQDNEEKSRILHATFFYDPPDDSGIDPEHEYPPPAFKFRAVTDEHIIRVAKNLNPYKAPGMNEIPNAVLTHCIDLLVGHLGPIYRATFKLDHYPMKWKQYKTVVLKKPGRPDYTNPSAYRPIALLDVIAKLLSACVKEIIEFEVDTRQLLPERQFGGRQGCTTTDSLHMLTKFTKDAWRKGNDVVALFLDVKGAFPNTVVEVLLHDMRNAGVPKVITNWLRNKMTGRETTIVFDDFVSCLIVVCSGLDQGCNLSGLLYRFYNASQITAVKGRKELVSNYADDTVCATQGKTMEEATKKMEELFHREGGPSEWARTHFSKYEYHKFACMGLTRRYIGNPDPQAVKRKIKQGPFEITVDEERVKSVDKYKFLGVIIDSELRFKQHAVYAIERGTKAVNQIRRLTKNAGGMRGELARRMYYSSVVPSMLYAADVWCAPQPKVNGKEGRGMKGVTQKLESVQRKAAIMATGALRTTPSDLLFAHADMTPMKEQIRKMCEASALRMATLPAQHPLYKEIQHAKKKYPKRHASPLHAVMKISKLFEREFEKIDIIKKDPRWRPDIDTTIDNTRTQGIEQERNDDSDVRIYTDGSGIEGKIGAAAVLRSGITQKIARHYLGPAKQHTVYEGENVGQILAYQLLKEWANKKARVGRQTISIAVDNQASIRAHAKRTAQPGSYLTDEIHKMHRDLTDRFPNMNITVRWIPGHEGLNGSEKADEEAKRAAKGEGKDDMGNKRGILRKALPASKAATKQELNRRRAARIQRTFNTSKRSSKAKAIDPTMPSNKYRKATSKLPKANASIWTQMRTEHVATRAYLYKFKLTESPTCQQCGTGEETVAHYFRHCKAYKNQRRELYRKLGGKPKGVEFLRGGKT